MYESHEGKRYIRYEAALQDRKQSSASKEAGASGKPEL
jgi:hypothetical protein